MVARSWLLSIVSSIITDMVITAPIFVLFFNVLMPLYIRHKVRANLYGGGLDPFRFKTFVPQGPSSRVAAMHPGWLMGRYIIKAASPKEKKVSQLSHAVRRSNDMAGDGLKTPTSPTVTLIHGDGDPREIIADSNFQEWLRERWARRTS